MIKRFSRAFTLMEINLAISIMALGVLSVISLFAFGYRESAQSNEDVASAAYADAVISQLVMAISQTNLQWSTFKNHKGQTSESGWEAYLESDGRIKRNIDSIAKQEFARWTSQLQPSWPNSWPAGVAGDLKAALVVQHDDESAIVRIGFRAAKTEQTLLSQPLYYTEVRFQGDPEK
ncbi:MAG: hypothetical protein J6S51_05795 [Kiritimatiellae bacterium]|nr:hypothetical protein [Kiritimatiellia bacterium]